MKYSHIEIKTYQKETGHIVSELYFDGHKVDGVRSIKFKHHAGELPVLAVELNAVDVSTSQDVVMIQESVADGVQHGVESVFSERG